jgi:heme O synthase-like polyprenyltransferase
MDTSVKRAGTAFRVCLLCVLVAALLDGSGCATQSYRDRPWDDVTGRQRDRAALDADYEKCRAVHEQAFLRSGGASTGSIDWAAQAGSDTAFLGCMERGGWKPRRGAAR